MLTSALASTFVSRVKVLLAESGSGVIEETVTKFVRSPEASGSTTPVMLIVSVFPTAIALKVNRLVLPLSGEGLEDEKMKFSW